MVSFNWEKIQNKIQYGTAIISFILNSILVLLIFKKSPKKLGAYRYLMICVSIFEMFYSIMDVIVSPIYHSYGSSFIVYVDLRRTIFSRETMLVLHGVYCGCFGFSMAIFGVHFIYRYLVASGSKILAKFNNWKVVTWFITPLIYGIVWGSTAYYLCAPNDVTNTYIENVVLETFDIKLEDLTYIGAYLYPIDENGQHYVSTEPAIAIAIFLLEVITSMVTIFYFATKCFNRINSLFKLSTSSAQYAGLQSQLFYALVTQTIIPILLMHIPASSLFLFTVMGLELGMACGIVSITIALYPAIDPFPTIFIVRSYRKGLYEYCLRTKEFLKFFGRKRSRGTGTPTTRYTPSY